MASKKIENKKIKDPILAVIANIQKNLGYKDDNVVFKFGDREYVKVPAISFGIDVVDSASNCGGVPRGKLVEIFGPESGGKSYLTLKLIASAQKSKLACCLVDAEQSFDPDWARQQGVDVDNLWLMNEPMSAEKTLNYVGELCKSKAFGLVVIDSTAALIPMKELEGTLEDQDYALLARVMSKSCKQIVANCGSTGTTCIFVNQLREKMGVAFGDNTTTPGGRALKFYAHMRIMVYPGKMIKTNVDGVDKPVGKHSWVTFVKNKVASPFGKAETVIMFDAAALHPVTMLANLAKLEKIFSVRNGEYFLNKDLHNEWFNTDEKKNVPTGATSFVELADYMVSKKIVLTILEKIVEDKANDDFIGDIEPIDKSILALLEDPSLITSPLSGTEGLDNDMNDLDAEPIIEETVG